MLTIGELAKVFMGTHCTIFSISYNSKTVLKIKYFLLNGEQLYIEQSTLSNAAEILRRKSKDGPLGYTCVS